MPKIIKMDAKLANLIAAGEVVEKPASVVKELVENAIDAHAKKISVYVYESGISKIKVIDDGDGMTPEDAKLAFLRHATSKIKNEYDLARIHTLGFRGEAVPSIAAVSLMQILTNDGSGGYQVTYKGGSIQSEGISPCQKGTTVTVENLFYNTPARLKYIKSLTKELSSIVFIMNKFAITNPSISFSLYSNDKNLIRTSGNGSYEELFGEIYGLNVAKNLIKKEFMADGTRILVVFAKPEIYRSTKLDITLCANGRYVRSNAIAQALIDAYYTQLPIGKFPVAAIYLDIDPILVDVNVHPTKIEIKISNEENICLKLQSEVKLALEGTVQIPKREVVPEKKYIKNTIFDTPIEPLKLNENRREYGQKQEKVNIPTNNNIDVNKTKITNVESKKEEKNELEENKEIVSNKLPYMEYIGQALGCYLIFQNENGLYLMDQHAAAERIKYEYYSKLLNNPNQPKSRLLFPIDLDLTLDESLIARDHLNDFNELGILMSYENDVIYVNELPMWLSAPDAPTIIRDIISLFDNNRQFDILYFRDRIAKQISCKSAIRANKRISYDEVNALLKELNKCENPYHCPHGRPTIINLTNEELEKMFERIVSWIR